VKLSPKQIDLTQDLVMAGGNIYLGSGSASTPSLLFSDHTNTGIYLASAAKIGISTSGVQRLFINTASVTSNLQIRGITGSASNPSYSFSSATNTGLFLDGGNLSLSVGGSTGLTLQSDGNLILSSSSSLKLPVGSTAQRPGTPVEGMTRFNSDNVAVEIFNGSSWLTVQTQDSNVVNNLNTIISDYTVLNTDYYILVNASSNNISITLPSLTGLLSGSTYTFKRIDSSSNTVTILPNSEKLTYVDGETSITIIKQYNSFTITTDSNNWFIV
jgi:hypothetical protein